MVVKGATGVIVCKFRWSKMSVISTSPAPLCGKTRFTFCAQNVGYTNIEVIFVVWLNKDLSLLTYSYSIATIDGFIYDLCRLSLIYV